MSSNNNKGSKQSILLMVIHVPFQKVLNLTEVRECNIFKLQTQCFVLLGLISAAIDKNTLEKNAWKVTWARVLKLTQGQ